MKFLFHAVTFINGVFTYWNIYLLDTSLVCAEDLDHIHSPVRLKIDDPDACSMSDSSGQNECKPDKILNALELHLMNKR